MTSMTLAEDMPLPREARDERVVLYNVPWERYVALQAALEDVTHARINYLEGTLEIMSPSDRHEAEKKNLARLLEAYADLTGMPLEGRGSRTFRSKAVERGAEPDECYFVGRVGKIPDLVIEVIVASGGIDKLELYRGLRVPEVWLHKRGKLGVYLLGKNGYSLSPASSVFPNLDLKMLVRLVQLDSQTEAVKALKLAVSA